MEAVAGKFQSERFRQEFEQLDADQMFAVSHMASREVFNRALPIARLLANRYCKKYDWVSSEDLAQSMVLEIPRFMFAYDPANASGTSWSKYLYHKLYYLAKDLLRKEDPLGVKWPQKKVYPKWHRLMDDALEGFEVIDIRELIELGEREAVDELIDEIKAWREYFAALPKLEKAKPEKRKSPKSKSRKKMAGGLWSWKQERERPKQLGLWG
jgi:DNA-directed RNA polymerase specialized sigma24 family protein